MAILSYVSANGNVPLTGSLSSSDWYIKHVQSGEDELTFYVDTEFPEYRNLAEETVVEYEDNDYVIKKIQDDKFDARLNLDFLKGNLHLGEYSTGSKTLRQQLVSILGNDWTITFQGAAISQRKTVTMDDPTDYDLINQFMSTYGCYFQWKTLRKTVIVHRKENESPSGKYLTDELNLKKVKFHGDTTDLITVIYPKGKDGTTIVGATVSNDLIDQYGLVQGVHYDSNHKYLLSYVECYRYTSKKLSTVWSDERYTVKENLLEDALAKVYESSFPTRTYECDVINLAKQNPDYAFLEMRMHLVLTLIDNVRGLDVDHRVVEYVEYPDNHNKDKITLAKVPSNITTTIAKLAEDTESSISKSVTALEAAIIRATQLITGNSGGYVVLHDSNNDGHPDEILVMDQADISTAVNVWRWNKNGLAYSSSGYEGPFETAITSAGEIVADFITAGHLDGSIITAGTVSAEAVFIDNETSLLDQFENIASAIEDGDDDVYDTVIQQLTASEGRLESLIQGFGSMTSESMTAETSEFSSTSNWDDNSNSNGSFQITQDGKVKASCTTGSYYLFCKAEITEEIKKIYAQPYYFSITLLSTSNCTVEPAIWYENASRDVRASVLSSNIVDSVGLNANDDIELTADEEKTIIVAMNFPTALKKLKGVGIKLEGAISEVLIREISLVGKTTVKNSFSRISQNIHSIESEVVYSSEVGTHIRQNAYSVTIAWNSTSQYIAFESGKLVIYDGTGSNHKKKATFDYNGEHFYHKDDNNEVGKIGTNHWTGNDNYKGLVFDLENSASYMCWAARDASNGNYNVKLAYYHKTRTGRNKGLYFECPTYANGNLYLDGTYNLAKISNGHVCYAGGFYFGTRAANNNGGYNYTDYIGFSGRNFTVYNGANVNFYANIKMNKWNITGQSDIRLKKNIAATQINGLEVLNSVDMKEFEWADTDEYVPIGIIAQQLNVLAPELIEIDQASNPENPSNGLMSIKTSNLIYYAIKAIQELSAQVEELQAGTYTGTTYTKSALNLSLAGTWNKGGDPVGSSSNDEDIPGDVSLPAEVVESENNSQEGE